MAARLLYPHARNRAQSPIPKTHPYRRIRELKTLADGLLGLVRLAETRLKAVTRDRDHWRAEAEALRRRRS